MRKSYLVAEWVAHGAELPQYSAAFRRNAVTVEDLPLLINDGGRLLESEFGVASPLHRAKLLRLMKALVLGLGQLPSAPLQPACATTAQGQAKVSWSSPQQGGMPQARIPPRRPVLRLAGRKY